MEAVIGKTVVFKNRSKHDEYPNHYPDVGTVGTIVYIGIGFIEVQWTKESTSLNDKWCCTIDDVEVLNETD